MANDLYAFKTENLDIHREKLERCLGLRMELHESSYVPGEEYYLGRLLSSETLQLQKNFDQGENAWAEEDFKDMLTLLYVQTETTDRADEIKVVLLRNIEGLSFLQREVFSEQDKIYRRFRVVNNREVLVFEKAIVN